MTIKKLHGTTGFLDVITNKYKSFLKIKGNREKLNILFVKPSNLNQPVP